MNHLAPAKAVFCQELKRWSVRNNITQVALTDLLKTLRADPHFADLPRDARTLLNTRSAGKSSTVSGMSPRHYCHFGLCFGLQESLRHIFEFPPVLALSFNIDGLPIAKSSSMQLWPIQCLVRNCGKLSPFVVGVFAGTSKPKSANEFLTPFVEELKIVLREGVGVNGCAVGASIETIICDAPAHAFVFSTKGHAGFSGCPKCTVEGKSLHGRTVFLDDSAPVRTDENFRCQSDPDHHKGTTVLTELPIDCIKSSPLDYMHLVCLGVVKRLLNFWMTGPPAVRLGVAVRDEVSRINLSLKKYVPREFSRKPRRLAELDRWKATEL